MNILDLIHVHKESSLPIVNQICDQLTWLISTGEIKSGQKLPPIRQAAQSLGVHMHTVRSAYHRLEDKGLVTTRPGQGTIAQPYVPFNLDSLNVSPVTHMIGVILPGINPFYVEFIKGVEEIARQASSMIMVINACENPILAEKYLDLLLSKNVDGIINASLGFSAEFQHRLNEGSLKLPIPIAYADFPGLPHSSVCLDTAGAAYQAVTHLLQHGHESVALINAPQEWPIGSEILTGFEQGMYTTGAGTSQVFIATITDFSQSAGYQAGLKLIGAGLRPTAVFAASDTLAIGAMRAFKENGLRIPQDMAVIGYNDIEMAALVDPPLTTVAAPTFELGQQVMTKLNEMIQSQTRRFENILLPTRLIIRQSCGCAA